MADRYTDPLTIPTPPDRVFYAPGTLLAAEDFQAEQLYHRSRLARVLAYLHGSGTAAGLWVYSEPLPDPDAAIDGPPAEADRLVVEPGLAVDRLGRLVEVPRSACLRLNRWFRSQEQDDLVINPTANGVVADIFIQFITCDRGRTPAFAAGLFDALDASQPARLRDGYELSLQVRAEDSPPLPVAPWQIPTEASPMLDPESPTQTALRDQQARALTDPDQQQQALRHNLLFDAWREGTEDRDNNGLSPLPEHLSGQDPTALFLARITIPATAAIDGQITRDFSRSVTIDNYSRRFVYPTAALTEWLGER